MASRPVSAETVTMSYRSKMLVSAKMLRMSSSTISTFLPASTVGDSVRFVNHFLRTLRGASQWRHAEIDRQLIDQLRAATSANRRLNSCASRVQRCI